MNKLKETNSFYVKEATDTRLRYSVTVPDDDENAMEEFKPIKNFGFLENFKRTLGLSGVKNQNNDENIKVYKHQEIKRKSKMLRELSDSIRLLENYINDADMKIYKPFFNKEYDNEELVKIYIPKKRI